MTTPTPAGADHAAAFHAALQHLPLVAILRGLTPEEAPAVGDALVEAGFVLIEVPLNSPRPFESITALRRRLPREVLVGAGTVLETAALDELAAVGAELAVMPHGAPELIRAAKARGLVSVPGVATPTEAFTALAAGADALKLFPAELITPNVVKAMRAVLPRELALLPVGGITPQTMAGYRRAGAAGFGLGSALYAPGVAASEVAARARDFVAAWRAGVS